MPDSFSYTSYIVTPDRQQVLLNYELTHNDTNHKLTERFVFAVPLPNTDQVTALLRALHLACGISYYKTFLPPVVTHHYQMSNAESLFWNDVFRGGLGEFLYVNKQDPTKLARFRAQEGIAMPSASPLELNQAALLGIGGGKDSIVAGELLKKIGVPVQGFVMATGETRGQAAAVAEVMQIPLHAIERTLDAQLLDLQKLPGAYSGHVPISLIFALTGSLLALACGLAYVVVANEDSASTPTATWAGEPVNHQWSKSFGFESALQDYLHTYVSPNLTYFSAIRPLSSVAVAKIFSTLTPYFEVFTSDNYVFRIDPSRRPNARWSLESPKSLSSFLLLAPWVSEADALSIFGRNFLDEASLRPLFLSLIGVVGEPPLDCVGTPPELASSLAAARAQQKWQGSVLLLGPELESLQTKPIEQFLTPSGNQRFPAALSQKLIDALKELLV